MSLLKLLRLFAAPSGHPKALRTFINLMVDETVGLLLGQRYDEALFPFVQTGAFCGHIFIMEINLTRLSVQNNG